MGNAKSMHWIRPTGLTLALLLLTTSSAAADPAVQQLESSVRASLATIGGDTDLFEPAHARPPVKVHVAPEASAPVIGERIASPLIATVRRVMRLTGGWRINAGISPGEQTLGVNANGRVVEDRWMNFHISVGLPLR